MMGCLSGCSFWQVTNYVYQNGEKYTAGDRSIMEKIETIDIDYLDGDVPLGIGFSITSCRFIMRFVKMQKETW